MKGLIITEEEKKRIKELYGVSHRENVLLEYEGQQIPITMNQTMQFQRWVWVKKDGNPNPDNMTDVQEKTKYNSRLCDRPCTAWGVWTPTGNGTYYRKDGAIDGYFGNKTVSLWNTYKNEYVKQYPTWHYDSSSFDKRVTGVENPTTLLQTKNFQKWYLEEIEKFCFTYDDDPIFFGPKRTSYACKKGFSRLDKKFSTSLCGGARCTYEQAVDGKGFSDVNSNTYKLWEKYKDTYKLKNKEWDKETEWSLSIQSAKDEEAKKEQKQALLSSAIRSLPMFWSNPAGWDGQKSRYSKNPRYDDVNGKYWTVNKNDADQHYADFGWKALTALYPEPKEYKPDDINKVLAGSKYYLQDNKIYLATDGGGVLQDENYTPTFTDRENWESVPYEPKELQVAKNMLKFNKELSRQRVDIPNYCTAMKGFTAQSTQSTPFSSQYGGGEGLDVDFWISTDDACVYAGGSWVYNFGGQKRCGCRDQSSPYVIENAPRGLVELNNPGYKLKSITLPNINKTFNFKADNDFQYNEITDWAKVINDVIPYIAIPLAVFGGPLGLGLIELESVLLAVDLLDAAAYTVRGDSYGAGLALMFGVIGAPKIMAKIPGVETALKEVGGDIKLLGANIGKAMTKGGSALSKYTDILRGLTEQGTWLRTTWDNSVPILKKRIKDASKVITPAAKVTTKTLKYLSRIVKWSFKKFVQFLLYLVKTEFLPISFLRNAGLQVGGTFMAWDMIAYGLGLCNTMQLESVDLMIEDMDSLEQNPAQLTEDDKEFLKSRPWLVAVYFAKFINSAQIATTPCEKIPTYLEMKKLLQSQEYEGLNNKLNSEADSLNYKVKQLLETIDGDYIPLPGFDDKVLAIQLVLNHYLTNRTTTEPITISEWGNYDKNTASAVVEFKKYAYNSEVIDKNFSSEVEYNTKIDKKLAESLIKYLDNLPEQIKNPSGISFEKEELYKLLDEVTKNTNGESQPPKELVEKVNIATSDWNGKNEEERKKIISNMKKVTADDFKFETITDDQINDFEKK